MENILSKIIEAENEIKSIKSDINDIKSRHGTLRAEIGYIKESNDTHLKKSVILFNKILQDNGNILLARYACLTCKKKRRIFKAQELLSIHGSIKLKSMIRKDQKSIKFMRHELSNLNKDIDAFKISNEIFKKNKINVITKKIHETDITINKINNKSIEIHKKSINSTKIFELNRLKNEIEICRNETMKYTLRNKKCPDNLKKLLNLSNAKNNKQETIVNEPEIIDNKQETMVNEPQITDNKQETIVNEPEITDNKQETTVNEQETIVNKQETMVIEQENIVNEPETMNNEPETMEDSGDDDDSDDDTVVMIEMINLVIMIIMVIAIINLIIMIITTINPVIMIIRIINQVIKITIIKQVIMIIKHLVK